MKYLIATAALAGLMAAAPALAQQKGLVNISVDGNTVQVPIGVAAQVCDVDANVLAQQVGSDVVGCEITQATAAEHNIGGQHGGGQQAGGGGGQKGLVNISVEGNTVQVPVTVAAQACGLDVNVIAKQIGSDEVACDINQETAAEHGITS